VMGIDGGGTNVRVVIADQDLNVLGSAQDAGVNPKVVGTELSAQRLQSAACHALADAQLPGESIAAVRIGLAGGGKEWDPTSLRTIMPKAHIASVGDLKIALVGARGEPLGVVILSGTGSGAFGISMTGDELHVGGVGYLLDDVGSGYWLGKEAVRRSLLAIDELGPPTGLQSTIMTMHHLTDRYQLVTWMYEHRPAVAQLAPIVLDYAAAGDAVAHAIIMEGAHELAHMVSTVMRRLGGLSTGHIAFAGGLLTTSNPLSRQLCVELNLPDMPQPRYPPVMGAALLAILSVDKRI
jgi:glucosamine kinase